MYEVFQMASRTAAATGMSCLCCCDPVLEQGATQGYNASPAAHTTSSATSAPVCMGGSKGAREEELGFLLMGGVGIGFAAVFAGCFKLHVNRK